MIAMADNDSKTETENAISTQVENISESKSQTVYGFCGVNSNSMKSPNPNSGVYEATTIRTLDCSCTNPSSNQGGMIIVENDAKAIHESIGGDSVNVSDVAYALRSGRKTLLLEEMHEIHPNIAPTLTASAGGTSRPGGGQGNELDYYLAYPVYFLQGNMIGRADHNGPQGNGINENNCFTINATDQHAVAFFNVHKHFIDTGMMSIKESDVASTQTARQHKSTTDYLVSINADGCFSKYPAFYNYVALARRLTPTECERLQGFPDDWTEYGYDYDSENDKSKPIADTPRYQMLGNSIAVPCVRFILGNIAKINANTKVGDDTVEKITLLKCWADELDD